jgi:hypothetical protein
MHWIEQILEETAEFEAPERYIYWAALASISAVCRKNLYLERFTHKLYPNIFVLLVGESGLKKGYPINLARRLVERTHCTRVIAGRYSIPAAIRELGKVYALQKDVFLQEAYGFLCNSELDAALVKDDDSFSVLTDLFDCHWNPKWDNWLKSGDSSLTDPYLVMIGGSNETNLKDAIPGKALHGGFVARTFVVYEEEPRTVNSLTEAPKVDVNISKLYLRLKEISNLKGAFHFTARGKIWFNDWYRSFKANRPKDATGTLGRIDDSILKIAMLISLSKRLSLTLDEVDLEEAKEKAFDCLPGMQKVFMGSGKAEMAEKTSIILKLLMRQESLSITRSKLLAEGWKWGEYDAFDLDRIIETLSQAGALFVTRMGGDVKYELKKEIADNYHMFKDEDKRIQ